MGTVILARHGQASYGAADYDQLSELGAHQAVRLAESLRRCRLEPRAVIVGEHRRHLQTAQAAELGVATVDPRWNEFDHDQILAAAPMPTGAAPAQLEAAWHAAKQRWVEGRYDDDYAVTYSEFLRNAQEALADVVSATSRGGAQLVISSAGVIASLVCEQLGVGRSGWLSVQRVLVNTGATRIVSGRRGPTLISFNDHSHLVQQEITYR